MIPDPATITPEEILTWVEGQIWSKQTWLNDHARNWPAHDVEMKQRDMAMLTRIAGHYRTWIEHRKEQAA